MALMRACARCGAPTSKTRCPSCASGTRFAQPCQRCGAPTRLMSGLCPKHDASAEATRHGRQTWRIVYDDPEWPKLKRKAKARAGGCCECCGKPFTKTDPARVDHIKPASEFPNPLHANRLSNLAVLRLSCHKRKTAEDARRRARARSRRPIL